MDTNLTEDIDDKTLEEFYKNGIPRLLSGSEIIDISDFRFPLGLVAFDRKTQSYLVLEYNMWKGEYKWEEAKRN